MQQRRLRDFGHVVGRLEPGPLNAITDVVGILVGQTTVIDEDEGVYSGVTAIVPTALTDGRARAVPAALHVGNGYGKFVGATQVMELGELETPILLTATLSTFRVADSLLTWLIDRSREPIVSVNPVVGEVNNGWLSTGDPRPVTPEHVFAALDGASGGPVAMGNVGGGTGACALGFKAGIGTASRRVSLRDREATAGVLVQANMGGDLRLLGRTVTPESLGLGRAGSSRERGSCVVVVALDVPCGALQLSRIAARSVFALGRVGASYSHGSGDYGLAFSAEPSDAPRTLSPAELDAVFAAVLDAVEEAVVDALLAARTVRAPNGREAVALPHQVVRT
ncbi:P1 family peptidase [Microtetraspora niveoalba]|uniref:P1 family peptidase n=1 Tax=Microtetraspora niveoalba TaxID=46175 RepID=UPI00082B6C5E|nr:P1 family peptidase [Microtetraspora niveoalba]